MFQKLFSWVGEGKVRLMRWQALGAYKCLLDKVWAAMTPGFPGLYRIRSAGLHVSPLYSAGDVSPSCAFLFHNIVEDDVGTH